MSSIYEEHLEVIVSHLNTPPTDHEDFYRVRNFVINLVRDNRLVKSTCKVNSICFGELYNLKILLLLLIALFAF